ncbi:ribosomal protein L29 [Geomicrobium halophilum]|uniref:Ribosomal protein L29 n=1 Tax=Geomicrobium halophilum TaxID=549000 RepID=A0A841PX87_9BACL|nr:SE1832 family protein [Geomicrobium halophilum]MBB6451251.1 ribosomal protein L29 [Geomicrobium halophilum]
MTVKELEEKLNLLKSDYVRVQGDVEKIESVGGNVRPATRQLRDLEKEISRVRQQMREANT